MAVWPPTITDCECEQPGFCARHNCLKGPPQHRLCRRVPGVFAAFERGEGPCQPIDDLPSDSEQAGPGMLRRGMNFARAAVRHAADGMELLGSEDVTKRLDVCQGL